jgi:nucleoside-diphosphate-sugar epimerase
MPTLHIADGIDLSRGTVEDMKEVFLRRLPSIETVTHVYFFAYCCHENIATESDINVSMLRRGLGAIEELSPNLQYVILPSGTKGYGIHIPENPLKAPFTEEMNEISQPWHEQFYHFTQHSELDRMQQNKQWKFAEVRCGPAIGFVPHGNAYNTLGIFMNFLSLYKFMHEEGHPDARSDKVPFPGPSTIYWPVHHDGSQDMVARFSIHLSLNPGAAGNSELYNIADTSRPVTMGEQWPIICARFGLKGLPPVDRADPSFRLPVSFVHEHADMVTRLMKERGVELQDVYLGPVLEGWMGHLNFHHDLSLTKARATGFTDEMPFEVAWKNTVDRYASAKKVYCGKDRWLLRTLFSSEVSKRYHNSILRRHTIRLRSGTRSIYAT